MVAMVREVSSSSSCQQTRTGSGDLRRLEEGSFVQASRADRVSRAHHLIFTLNPIHGIVLGIEIEGWTARTNSAIFSLCLWGRATARNHTVLEQTSNELLVVPAQGRTLLWGFQYLTFPWTVLVLSFLPKFEVQQYQDGTVNTVVPILCCFKYPPAPMPPGHLFSFLSLPTQHHLFTPSNPSS